MSWRCLHKTKLGTFHGEIDKLGIIFSYSNVGSSANKQYIKSVLDRIDSYIAKRGPDKVREFSFFKNLVRMIIYYFYLRTLHVCF